MLTFNIQAYNRNYYRGHEPSNSYGNCWTGESNDALCLTIEQTRDIIDAMRLNQFCGSCKIEIALSAEPISPDACKREIFCLNGGHWGDYKRAPRRSKLNSLGAPRQKQQRARLNSSIAASFGH